MKIKKIDFLISALTDNNPFMTTEEFFGWFEERKAVHKFSIEQISFKDMEQWRFEPTTGNLTHASGRFFKIEGIWVETNYGHILQWSQPIINQPEIGILGIITKKINGILYFLMQAKMEPGNINMIQLAPTLQATQSNFTRVHKGKSPPYLEYFLNLNNSNVLIDILQSEQGARFLHKRNRNIIIYVDDDIPVYDDYCWLTLGQIQELLQTNNIINMDARTVISCIQFQNEKTDNSDASTLNQLLKEHLDIPTNALLSTKNAFQEQIIKSELDRRGNLYNNDEIISWFTRRKFFYNLNVERIPLKYVQDWVFKENSISHKDDKFFSVIAVKVEADNREVKAWTQPLIKPREEGIVAFIVKHINGVLHMLVQAKVEPGNFDIVEIAPTVQCLTGSYRDVPQKDQPRYLDYILNASEKQIRYRSRQSEEGGRFFREQNLNIIVEADESFDVKIPDNYIWLTIRQLREFIKYNNFVNVQARCLLSCMGLIGVHPETITR